MFFTPSLVYLLLGAILIGMSLLVVILRLAQRPGMQASHVLNFVALMVGVLLVAVNVPAQTPVVPPTPSVGQFRGTVNEVVNGDLMCYVTLSTTAGRFTVGAGFEVCDPQWVGQEVDFTVAPGRVNACESAEPCGKSQDLLLIVGMSPVR